MMMKKLYWRLSLAAFMLLFCSSVIMAQDRTVTGTITDENGQALPGVNVLVKGTSQGTVSDSDGKYSLAGVGDNATLVFSFIGYLAQEVPVAGKSVVDVGMSPDITSLEEVVVVGYGEQKKSLVTGAISSVKSEDLKSISVGSIDQAIQGRTAGVLVVPTSGQPGSGSRIRIRGVGSNGNANPLYIIDGVRSSQDGMDFLNPSDIQNIEVLKDAASSAIYGAEGANGVVIVTTKKGKAGVSEINYSGQFTQQTARQIDLMNADQYQTYMQESGNPSPTDAEVGENPNGTNWQDVAFSKAPIQNHTLSFTGGTDKSNLYVSLGYFSQDGIAGGKDARFTRYSARINSNHKLKDWLNVGENFSYTNRTQTGFADNTEYGGVMSSILSMDPITQPIYSQDDLPAWMDAKIAQAAGAPYNTVLTRTPSGDYYGVSRWLAGEFGNPLAIYHNNNTKTTQNKVLGNVFVEISPIKDLKITSRFGIDAAFQNRHTWSPLFFYSTEQYNNTSDGNDAWDQWFTTQWENFVNYDRQIGDHHLGFVVGTAMQKYRHDFLNGSYSNLFAEEDKWSYPNFVPDADDRIGGSFEIATLMSYFGRASYDYKGKYLFDVTVRRDGSSKFAQPWGTFPSFSAGWVLSNEDFFQPAADIVSFFKLRASWGQNGSIGNVGVGQWKNSVSNRISGPIRYPNEDGVYLVGAAPTQAENPNLTWETSEQMDIGADIRFLDDRLTFAVDYFKKTTKDLLAEGNPPAVTGVRIPWINAGEVENTGLEFELGYRSEIGTSGFKYDVSANFSTLKNQVTALAPGVSPPATGDIGTHWNDATRFTVGDPIWSFWGYKTAGIFQNQAQIDQYISDNELTGYAPVPGDPIVVDTNNDGTISPSDFAIIGNPHPKYYFGARVNLSFKGFDLLVFLSGQGGNDILMGYFRNDRGTANKPAYFFEDRWTGDGSTNSWFRASTTGPAYTSDFMVASGAFTKIRQLQLGYTLPASINETLRIKNLRVYVSLDNFFVFTKYKGFDPEVGNNGINTIGIDRGTYPFPKKVVGGLSLTF